MCWKPIVLLPSLLLVKKQIDLQKYRVWQITLWRIIVLLWCIVPFSFPGPLIVSAPNALFARSVLLMGFWGLYTVVSTVLGLSLTIRLLAVASPFFKKLVF
jgi:hypothetical protein